MLSKTTAFTIAIVVALGGCAMVASSEIDEGEEPRPDHAPEKQDGDTGVETVLRVQYDGGLIKGLFVAQRGGAPRLRGGPSSVVTRRLICEDLCTAGLGGSPCGWSCEAALPAKLASLTANRNKDIQKKKIKFPVAEIIFGKATTPSSYIFNISASHNIKSPRTNVCPTLCKHGLGHPLCECLSSPLSSLSEPSLSDICSSFCHNQYQLSGCPICEDQGHGMTNYAMETETPPSDLWVQWCQYQCTNGEGGAACKCDLAPLSLIAI